MPHLNTLSPSEKIASDLTKFSKYCKFIPSLKRRETWDECIDRCLGMHLKQRPQVSKELKSAFERIKDHKILPAMRSLQFAGDPILKNNARIYNCGFMTAKHSDFFSECMFLLLGGTGVGYSVQKRHISQLPTIKAVKAPRKFLVGDSIEGWADAVKVLMEAYFKGKALPRFDFSDIRKKGSALITAGGKAPGPGPLRVCLAKIQSLLESKEIGSKLTSVEVSDIACFIADAVLSGGIRRAAMIALFDMDDIEFMGYKTGNWYESNGQRGRVNVSAVGFRNDLPEFNIKATTKEQLEVFFDFVKNSGSGEPGLYWTNHPDWGTNPCCEIALRDMQFCNLSTINFTTIQDDQDFVERAYYASIIGTIQASYTDFHYLRDEWKENSQEEALIGVSITGIGDVSDYYKYDFSRATRAVIEGNYHISKKLGINSSARMTCVKPEGTASLVLGTASGVHARHSPYYIRRLRYKKNEPIAIYLLNNYPEIAVQDKQIPDGICVELPIKSPDKSLFRDEDPIQTLERVKFITKNWVFPGFESGENIHNVSCTINVKPELWKVVHDWMWENRAYYNGISLFPYDGGTYVQTPFEECTEEEYERRMSLIKDIDLTKVNEEDDYTNMVDQIACAGGSCEIG